ncbi:MAG: hypothetical protein ACFB51_11910, partial [Anaerolineae bacterium]
MEISTGFPVFLTILLLIPFTGFLVVMILPSEQKDAIRWSAAIVSLLTFAVSLVLQATPYARSGGLFWDGAV